MARLLVIGASGMLGEDLCAEASGHEVLRPRLDITDPGSVTELLAMGIQPDWVVNCAAYTAVDKAESEPQAAFELNVLGVAYLAQTASQLGAGFLHISTDFVFDGEKRTPYTEDDPTNPMGVYGQTKLEGEAAALANHPQAVILRTSWLYGAHRKCFPRTILDAYRAGRDLKVVADQIGSPTSTVDLARTILDLIALPARPFPGVYHASGPEPMTWHDFAVKTVQEYERQTGGSPRPIHPIQTEDWPTPAKRPFYSVLDNRKLHDLGIPPMRPTRESLAEFVERYRVTSSS